MTEVDTLKIISIPSQSIERIGNYTGNFNELFDLANGSSDEAERSQLYTLLFEQTVLKPGSIPASDLLEEGRSEIYRAIAEDIACLALGAVGDTQATIYEFTCDSSRVDEYVIDVCKRQYLAQPVWAVPRARQIQASVPSGRAQNCSGATLRHC